MKAQYDIAMNATYEATVLHIVDDVLAIPYDVASIAPDTLQGVTNHWRLTGRLLVWDGACDTTVFSAPSVNHAFRAFHDYCHVQNQRAFNEHGERLACADQIQIIRDAIADQRKADIAARHCWADIVGIIEHRNTYGNFPTNQRAFIADYLAGDGWLTHGAY
jgi:hypothetical protein